jgi:hypothetical protein
MSADGHSWTTGECGRVDGYHGVWAKKALINAQRVSAPRVIASLSLDLLVSMAKVSEILSA